MRLRSSRSLNNIGIHIGVFPKQGAPGDVGDIYIYID